MLGDTTYFFDRGSEDRRVRIIDGSNADRLAGRDDLVPRRDDRYARFAADLDASAADRRQHADLTRGELLTSAENRLASSEVTSGEGNELSGRGRGKRS